MPFPGYCWCNICGTCSQEEIEEMFYLACAYIRFNGASFCKGTLVYATNDEDFDLPS
jgi:hypothetical protein